MRLPLRLLPAAIATAGILRRAACAAATRLSTLETDLKAIHDAEGFTWADVEAAAERHYAEKWCSPEGINEALRAYLHEPRCHVCQQSDDDGYCTKCAVLNTGRVAS